MDGIRVCLSSVRARQQWQQVWRLSAWGLVASSLTCLTALGVATFMGSTFSGGALTMLLLAGPALGALLAITLLRPRMREAALTVDHVCGLKDRAVTAWVFLSQKNLSVVQQLQLQDAASFLSKVEPRAVAPFKAPRSFAPGVILCGIAIALAFLLDSPEKAEASTAPNEVIASQATRAEEELKELEQFNEEAKDPEIEQLLKELAAKVEELKQPGIDPKEALAKLSEMEAALQAKQQQLAEPQIDAQLRSVGEALSLADPLQSAGQALSSGELEKAAEELEKQELPQLDRQTERAITEKLDKVKQESADGMAKALKEAIGQLGEGLGQGNKSKFQDGMQGLAGEARKQGRRKKLSDLLKKQCQCLSECKSECEGECQNPGQSNKKGGSKAGLAASGNEPGEKTPLLKSAKDMKLTGQESAEGDVDIETTTAPEQQQEAVRRYREKVDKYQALSESVLDAESIPLGHRQNIRRYFEMIRPQAGDLPPAESR